MTAETESLVLEHLCAIRVDVSDLKERMGRVELRLSAIEQILGSALSDSDRDSVQWLVRRVEHINGARN